MRKAVNGLLAGILAVGVSLVPTAVSAGHGGGGHGGGGHGGGGHFGGGHFGGGHFGGSHIGHFSGFHGRHFGGWGHHGGWARGHVGGRHFAMHGARAHFAGHPLGHGQRAAHNQLAHAGMAHNALAHNVGRFHGLNTFNRNGFNRNAFGHQAAWNHWGANHWGPGWNNWGTGWGFWAGSVFWPFFWGDLLTCGLWPNAYFCPFWAYGPDVLLTSIFWPGPYYGLDYAYWPNGYGGLYDIYGGYGYGYRGYGYANRYTPVRHRHARVPSEQFAERSQTQACSGLAPGITDLPFDRIERVVRPTGEQIAALDELKSASDRASETLTASCPTEVPLTPVARLDAMQKRLEAMIRAVQTIRAPLETFYNSLTDEQKQHFNAMGGGTIQARSSSPATGLANLFGPQSESFTQLPLQRIDETIQPSEQQQTALNDLKTASSKAASELQASCPSEALQTPADRLDAITKRLDAMVQAGKTVRPALNSFYASLNDEQKARFNVIGQSQGQPASQATSRGN